MTTKPHPTSPQCRTPSLATATTIAANHHQHCCILTASQVANLGESVIGVSLQEKEGFRWGHAVTLFKLDKIYQLVYAGMLKSLEQPRIVRLGNYYFFLFKSVYI
ncbi:uncharacterized protein LOC114298455 [Camellia sinensis]|uniref:uncharacterized protein LOC114298455 n=1 Tax=Camellia sinensis TaxID=4442 RepID=UPI001036637B|nr:uncharacterized protein LOC114298455 [Camellia sinensis]